MDLDLKRSLETIGIRQMTEERVILILGANRFVQFKLFLEPMGDTLLTLQVNN